MSFSLFFTRSFISQRLPQLNFSKYRNFTVLAIETSCDDTSVAILHSPSSSLSTATLLAHKTVTSPNRIYGGIHPIISVAAHRAHLAPLISSALSSLPTEQKPDLVAVTRGPGMLASLAVGMDTAKGLALAWGVPLIGVNHMQAHALTPRLLSALENAGVGRGVLTPEFPFMTLLVSGGHTMVVKSGGLTSHTILAETTDIALGDMVDKCARTILPKEVLEREGEVVAYGAVLEEYCFPDKEGGGDDMYGYHVDGSEARKLEDKMDLEKWGDWKLSRPLTKTGMAKKLMQLSFCGLGSTLDRYFENKLKEDGEGSISKQEKKEVGRKVMMLAFEHVASRVVMGLDSLDDDERRAVKSLVVSGGVAANQFLKHLLDLLMPNPWYRRKLIRFRLKRYLEGKGYPDIQLVVPPQRYCTDNAAMIAWAGLEMYKAGWETDVRALPIRKWSLDNNVRAQGEEANGHGTGGVLGVAHWKRRNM